jgi:ATP:ADP antiporter, AAA family
VACLFGLFGTSYFQRTFGVRFSLMIYPILLGIFIATYMVFPTLFLIAAVVIVAKAIYFVFNMPAKEMLYIPTSKEIKYKAKAWIDMFGMRFGKGTGALLNDIAGPWVMFTGIVSLAIICIWTSVANVVGTMFNDATKREESIE